MSTNYLKSKGYTWFEGNSGEVQDETIFLGNICDSENIKEILEIGFNTGHSSEIFLINNKNANVTSFDLGQHDYVKIAKEYIDEKYPLRHTLIIGDSNITIPFYNTKKFDLMFIDGGHDFNIAYNDIKNCKKLAKEDTIVVIDDISDIIPPSNMLGTPAYIGATKAWNLHIKEGNIIEIDRKDFGNGRGIAYGKYNIKTLI